MNCTYCGAALPAGARLCSACGKLLPPTGTVRAQDGVGPPRRPETDAADTDQAAGGPRNVLRSNIDAFEASAGPSYAPLLVEVPAPTVRGSYEHAWRQLQRFFLPLFVVGLIYVLVQIPISLIDLAFEERLGPRIAYQLVTGLLISTPLGMGLAFAFLRAARGERPEVGDLFVPYRRAFGPSIATTVLYALCVLVALVPAIVLTVFAVGTSSVGLLVGLALLIVPGIFVAIRLGFYPYLVVGEGYGPVAALQESWQRTRGYGWTVLGVSLSAIPIALVGLIALIVGIIPAVLLIQLAEASLFVAISASTSR